MKFFSIMTFAMLIFMMSFICIWESIAQTTSENENTQIKQALSQLPKGTYGHIVWMSNREGNWNIYRMDIPSGKTSKLTQNNADNNDARISDDGKLIAWSSGDNYKRDVWIMNADGTDQHLAVSNASMSVWRPDGKLVINRGKDPNTSFIYDPNTKQETKIWPPDNFKLETGDVVDTALSPDGKMIVGWSNGTWIFSADGTVQKHVHGGCEGHFSPDSSFVYWVMEPGTFGKASLQGEVQQPLYKSNDVLPDPYSGANNNYGHTYFPKLSKNMDYLIFGACPNGQHDHNTSDYEIFLMKMDDLKPAWEKPIRLTYDPRTDRWPDIFINVDTTPPNTPQALKAESLGQNVKIVWNASQDPESGVIGYNIYRNTNKGVEEIIAREVKDTSYIDYATDAKTKYQYNVCAINSAGLESQKLKSVTILTKDTKPVIPKNIYVSGNGLQARLKWQANAELDIKGYNVYRSLDPKGRYEKINKDIVVDPVYSDNSIEDKKIYYYSITAVDKSKNEGSRSNPVSFGKRVSDSILALYLFDEGQGSVVKDQSGVEPPLNLKIKDNNRVLWIKDVNAIEFIESSMVISDGNADKLFNNLKDRNEISVEAWVSPANLAQTGPARIVSISGDTLQRDFTLGQIGEDLAIRLRTTKTEQNGIPELDTQKHVLTQQPTHIITTYDGNTKKLYINGQLHSESQQLNGDFSNWTNYPLILGNELTGDRTWIGKIYLVAIYNRSLTPDEIFRNYQSGL
jgi:hypothetical protein